MKHKWHDEIVSFANGIEIEVKHQGYEWEKADNLIYIDNDKVQYRIKPQPIQQKYLYFYRRVDGMYISEYPPTDTPHSCIGKIEVQDV